MGYNEIQVTKMVEKLRDSDYEYVSVRLATYRAKLELAQKMFADNPYSKNKIEHIHAYNKIRYNEIMIKKCEEILTEKENNYGY